MNIVLLNGSPKGKNGISQFLSDKLGEYISAEHHVENIIIDHSDIGEKEINILLQADIIVFIFPLYVDAIPSHLFRVLVELEKVLSEEDKTIYAVVNCGFYEGRQTALALDILKHWCTRTDLMWGQGVGIGAGEMIQFNKKVPLGHGPLTNMGNAYQQLSQNIETINTGDNIFISPNFPRFAYMLCSKFYKWYPLFIKNKTNLRSVHSQK